LTVNRYAAGCFLCSLDVLPGGGQVCLAEGAWHVLCRNCYERHQASSRDDEPPPLPPGPPHGCRPTISLRVLGLYRECWKCGEMTLCVGALYPDRHATEINSLITCGEGEPLEVARTILQAGGRNDLSSTIRPRYSRTASGTYISNGCQHCDTIQGAFYIDEVVTETVTATRVFNVDALVTLVVGPCPSETWQHFILGE
jgi:hypothetical protein